MTSEGRESITWYESGNPDIDTAIAALERTQFLMQIRDWETHREVLITDIAEDEQEEDEEELEDEEDA
jgi:hypothetical protein